MADDVKAGGVALELKIDTSKLYSDTQKAAEETGKRFTQRFKSVGQNIEQTFNQSFKEVKSAGSSAAESLVSSFKKLGTAVVAAFSVSKIKEGLQNVIESAATVSATQSSLTQTFKEYESAATSAMQEVADSSGILETRLQSVGTQIYSFAKTSGMDSVTALDLMKRSLQVTADSAAYYDRSLEDTAESLKSFLKGNYANDAALGVSATETTRNAEANKLYGQSFKDLSEAQKQLTLLQMVEDANSLSGAMGQAAREADNWENVTGNLKEAWNQLLAAVGKPVLSGAISIVKTLTEWISKLATYAQAASEALGDLFGWNTDGGANATAATATNTAQTASSIADSVDNQNALTDAVAETNAEVKRGLAGFDKLNVISKTTASNASSSGSKSGGTSTDDSLNSAAVSSTLSDTEGGVDKISNKLSELKEKFKAIIEPVIAFYNKHIKPIVDTVTKFAQGIIKSTQEWFKNLNWGPLEKAFGNFFDSIKDFIDEVSPSLQWLWDNVVLPMGKILIETILPTIVNLLASINRFLSPIITALVNIFKPIWENILKPAIERISEWFKKIVEKIGPKLEELGNKIGEALKKWQPIIEKISEVIGPVITKIIDFLGGSLGGALEAGLESLGKIIDGIGGIADVITGFAEGDEDKIASGFGKIGEAILEALIAPFKHIWAAISGGLEGAGVDVSGFFSDLWDNITGFFSGIGDWFAGVWENISGFFSGIGDWFAGIWENVSGFFNGIGEWFTNLWNRIVNGWHIVFDPWIEILKRAADWVNKNVIEPVVDFFKGLWDNVSGFFTGLWDDICGVWSTVSDWFNEHVIEPVTGFFSGIWEKISNGANDAWEGVKSAFSHVSDWFKNVFSEAWQKVQDVFSEGGKIFNNIKEGIADTFKLVVNNIIDGINTVIGNTFEGLNNALSTIHEVEILGVKPFEWINPIDVPVIPKFATGAIVKAPTLAVVGDNPGAGSGNPEVIAPLNKLQGMIGGASGESRNTDASLTKIIDILTRMYEMATLDRNSGGQTARFAAEINGTPIFDEMIRLNETYKARHGRSAFL